MRTTPWMGEVERRRKLKPSVSANNHQGQEDKSFQQQAGYMRAMISSHINVKMSCKRSGFIYVGKGREHDHMDVGGRTNQETESRSGSFTTLEKGMPFPSRCVLPTWT